MNSLKNELVFLFAGKGMPYEKVCLMVAIVVTIVLANLLQDNIARDASVAVIDLDNSRYSHELIQEIDNSSYMKVNAVINSAVDPNTLFYRDQAIAVIYLPRDLEKNRLTRNGTGSIGVFYDQCNAAQCGNIKEALSQIVAEENSNFGATNGSNIALNSRLLYNPVNSAKNAMAMYFLFFFGSMFFTFATLSMVSRLRVMHKLDSILIGGNPWNLIVKLVPYVICFVSSMFLGLTILHVTGDLGFNGNPLLFLFLITCYAFVLGTINLIVGWNAPNPGMANSRMIFIIPGGFILGGATNAVPYLPVFSQYFSHIFPLTWVMHFIRDVVMRGAGFADIAVTFGQFMIYAAVFGLLFVKLFYDSCREAIPRRKREEADRFFSRMLDHEDKQGGTEDCDDRTEFNADEETKSSATKDTPASAAIDGRQAPAH